MSLFIRGGQGGAIPTKNRHTTGVFFYYVTSTKSLKTATPTTPKKKPSLWGLERKKQKNKNPIIIIIITEGEEIKKERKILNVIDTSTPSTLDSRISLTLPSGSRKPRVCVCVCVRVFVSYCRIYMRRWRRSAGENTRHNYRKRVISSRQSVCVCRVL